MKKQQRCHNHCIHKNHDISSVVGEYGFMGQGQGFIIWGTRTITCIFALSQDIKHCFSNCGIRSAYGTEIRAKCQILLQQNAIPSLLTIQYSSFTLNIQDFVWWYKEVILQD